MLEQSQPDESPPQGTVEEFTVGPGEGWSRIIEAEQHLRIIDLVGQQAVDFLCYRADDPEDGFGGLHQHRL